MDDLQKLEEELLRCEEFLNCRSPVKAGAKFGSAINIKNSDDVTQGTGAAPAQSKPQTLHDLLNYFESAPEGPIELDPSLLYSPRSSVHEENYSALNDDHRYQDFENLVQFNSANNVIANAAEDYYVLGTEDLAPGKTHLSKLRALKRLEELRREKQQQEMEECTFAPRTGRNPTGARAQLQNLRVEERLLLASGKRKEDAARRIQEEREEAEKAQCTFAPQLVAKPERYLRGDYKPIHERLNEEWRRKEEAIAEAKAKADEEVLFKPKINPTSVRLAAKRHCQETNERQAAKPAPASPETTFQPSINPVSSRILERSTRVPADFHRRQRHFDRKREEHLQALVVQETEEKPDLTFNPATTGTATALLALSDRRFNQVVERPEERWERMAVLESEAKEARLRRKEAQIRAEEASFAPQLNPRSLKLAQHRQPLHEAVMEVNSEKQAAAAAKIAEARKYELRECSFAPNINKPRVIGYYDEYDAPEPYAPLSIAVQGPEALLKKIEEQRRVKEQRAAKLREEAANKELAACTFAPNTSKPAVAMPHGPVPVAGLDRYMEMKAYAERKQLEAAERAAKVFNLRPSSPAKRGPTLVKPFRLATEARRQKAENK